MSSADRQKKRLRGRDWQVRSGPFGLALVWAPNPGEALARFIAETVFRSFVRDELLIEEMPDGGARTTFAGITYVVKGEG